MNNRSLLSAFFISILICGAVFVNVIHVDAAQGSGESSFNISGYILDSDGNGVAGANIIFNVPDIVPSVYSDASGYYLISAPAGTYHVNVWPPFDSNYIYYDEPAFVVDSDVTKNITQNSGYKVSGYITDLSGTPVVKAVVSLNNFLCGWYSTYSGYYFVTAPAGTYTLNARPANGPQDVTDFSPYSESNIVVNSNFEKNITVNSLLTPSSNLLNVELKSNLDGQASFATEEVHTSSNSVKLVIPTGANVGSYAIALYPYNKALRTLSTFSVYTSYVNATPRFVIYLDKNNDGVSESILLSDYQFTSNGAWKVTTGGYRWGWTESNMHLSVYGVAWQQLDYWKTEYGNINVPYIGIALEYWAVDPDGFGEPLYADELILNGVTYTIAPVLTPAPSPASDSDSWPMFHNDVAHSGYTESSGPLTNQLLWKYQTGSGIESSPAVVDGVVYFGSLWNGQNGFVNALNATTGSKIWQYATNSGIESSPAVVDGVVYIGSYSGNMYALNAASGSKIWAFNTGGSVFPSPAVVDGVVYVGSANGYMYALNAATGSPSWSYYTGGLILSSPAVIDGVVYFGSEDQNFYALQASDGSQIWNYSTGGFIDTSPVVVGGIVYFGSRDGYVYALNAFNGSEIWSFRPLHGNYGSYYYSTPAVANGVIYVGGYDSYIYALNAASGDLIWESPIGGYIFSSPVVAGGFVYAGSFDGKVYALNAITGGKIWSYQTGGKMRASCAVVNGVAYVGSDDGYLYAFGSSIQPAASYEISGYILDENGNGIEGAHIIFNVPELVPSVTSDASGYYVISAPAGTYHVNVWPPFDSNYINYDEPGFTVTSDMTKNITLQSGYKVSGYITDTSGNPVVGAVVSLDNYGSGWFSNSSGYYFLSVPAGTYTITAHPRTGNYYSGPTTYFPTYYEYNFTVNAETVKNITVGSSSPTSSADSEPVSSPDPS
ncbi:PQQ-binding-like beta-propeller repeat protein, partial [Candidatus Bathyarchaeota archaeon]|nr:PQQ-binding-like beta-propeller repeat protein [Candidatus Bathyarchaeota archaeon]